MFSMGEWLSGSSPVELPCASTTRRSTGAVASISSVNGDMAVGADGPARAS